jgi:23S rRNA pseudouridine2604 synthase
MGRQTFRITLTQGLNRQIRRMCEYLGYAVTGLQRVRIMNIKLDKLALGKWRYLSDAELSMLMENIADSSKVKTANKPAARASTPSKRGFNPKDGEQAGKSKSTKPASKENKSQTDKRSFTPKDREHTGKGKSIKPAAKEDKSHTGKKEEKFWKRESPSQKSTKGQHTRPEKNSGKEKKGPESKKGRRGGVEGSFKNFRNKGRR